MLVLCPSEQMLPVLGQQSKSVAGRDDLKLLGAWAAHLHAWHCQGYVCCIYHALLCFESGAAMLGEVPAEASRSALLCIQSPPAFAMGRMIGGGRRREEIDT